MVCAKRPTRLELLKHPKEARDSCAMPFGRGGKMFIFCLAGALTGFVGAGSVTQTLSDAQGVTSISSHAKRQVGRRNPNRGVPLSVC